MHEPSPTLLTSLRHLHPTSDPWDWMLLFLNVSGALMDGWMSVVEAAGNLQAPGIRGGFLGAYTSFPALGGHVGELVHKVGIVTAVFYVVVTLVLASFAFKVGVVTAVNETSKVYRKCGSE